MPEKRKRVDRVSSTPRKSEIGPSFGAVPLLEMLLVSLGGWTCFGKRLIVAKCIHIIGSLQRRRTSMTAIRLLGKKVLGV